MPTLHWIGKEKVINHHLDVPYRVLDHAYGYRDGKTNSQETESGNKIIHGDNLEALKSLLPEYEGRIQCIYIDPPYNTGNEGWVYNDNVNDPKIKKWLGHVVGKESEDLSRHDKWLCMMYPRLKLLQKLLSENGVIFISCDDIEQANLRLMLDEIFIKSNFISQFIWKSRQNKDNRNINKVSNDHEYIICYGKTLKGIERDSSTYSNPDNDPRGPWVSENMVGLLGEKQRPNLHYDLVNPKTGINYGKPKMGWRYDQTTMSNLIEEDRIIWPSRENGRPRRKKFISELKEDVNGYSSIIGHNIYTRNGTSEIQSIFGSRVFEFSKPSELIKELILQSTSNDSIILDSFAGSGTTAQAVLNQNKLDGGNRKFILIEMQDYAESITAERVKRVIKGYGDKEGTGGSFDYYTLGQPIFNEEGHLNETVGITRIRQYVFYTETKTPLANLSENAHSDLMGTYEGTAYYFYYDPDIPTTLDRGYLSAITEKADQYVIYADNCLLDPGFMLKHNIIFKKIPRDITRF